LGLTTKAQLVTAAEPFAPARIRESVVTMWSGPAYTRVVRATLVALLAVVPGPEPTDEPPPDEQPAASPAGEQPSGYAPRVIGKRVDEAERILLAWRADIRIDRYPEGEAPTSADLRYGQVYSQSLDGQEAGGMWLEIVGQIPDLVGLSRTGAEERLRLYGMVGVFRPADAPAMFRVKSQDPPPGRQAAWRTPVEVELVPAPVPSRSRPTRVRVPRLIGLSVEAARASSAEAGLRLDLVPDSAANGDRITDQDPEPGQRVARGTRIWAEAIAAGAVPPAPAPSAVVGPPDPVSSTAPPSVSVSEVLVKAGGSVLLLALLGLLAVRGWMARAPKRAGWVQVHVHAHPVGDVVGKHTTSAEDAIPSRSVRVRAHVGPGRHTLEETSR
jgi:hypothetical protein